MAIYPNESVLVFPAAVLHQVGYFRGVCLDVGRYLSAIQAPGISRFLSRSKVEEDPSFKQVIPYVILKCRNKVFNYTRGKRGKEPRLREQLSIGLGGHIKESDEKVLFGDITFGYRNALLREISEEVKIECPYEDTQVAVINDDSNKVGRVHFGVVHMFELESPAVEKKDWLSLKECGFVKPDELVNRLKKYESWSRLCIEHVLPQHIKDFSGLEMK